MDGTPIELDTALDVCEHEHRRTVRATLVDQQQAAPRNDLTNATVEHNHYMPLAEASSGTVTGIQTALHPVPLPKLDEAELIEYDPERQVVEPAAQFDREESHLSVVITVDSELPTPPEGR